MKRRLEEWLAARWYGGIQPEWPLRSLAALFGAIVKLRQVAFRRGWRRSTRLPVPVLVVGNLAIGGAGKTPTTIALIDALRARGWSPGVVSRGYGGTEPGPAFVAPQADPRRFGDEPCLIANRTGAPVAIARRRADAGKLLLERAAVDLLIADDGLQHYALQRDLEILLIDGRRRFGNRRLLPAGPLREPPGRAAECAFTIVNGGTAGPDEWPMRLTLDAVQSLHRPDLHRPLSAFAGRPLHAVAGIADPERFFDALRAAGLEIVPHPFPDHHAYAPGDLAFGDGLPLLMTEKDAVKCAAFAAPNWFAVPAVAELPEPLYDRIAAMLAALPRNHR